MFLNKCKNAGLGECRTWCGGNHQQKVTSILGEGLPGLEVRFAENQYNHILPFFLKTRTKNIGQMNILVLENHSINISMHMLWLGLQ